MRNDALLRTLQTLSKLTAGPRTLEELADIGGVCTRTVRRDLEVLSLSGFPVTSENFDDGSRNVWRLTSTACAVCGRGRGH